MSTEGGAPTGAATARPLACLSSMATRGLLAELVATFAAERGRPVDCVSVGGVEAARRLRAGEAADVVVLAAGPMAALEAEGLLAPGLTRPIARSAMAAAVPAGAELPDIGSAAALRRAIAGAGRIAFSTGPSGDRLLALLAEWGLDRALADRMVRAAPGEPVATLLAQGRADIGFQQTSELLGMPGIALLGPLPDGTGSVTTFSAGIGAKAGAAAAAGDLVAFLASGTAAAALGRHGMSPP